jgi:predicted DNA-binding WGR domain protein
MKRHFSYKDDLSDKFWRIEVDGVRLTIAYGKTGRSGVTASKNMESNEAALQEADKMIREKLRKGFKEIVVVEAGPFNETEFWNLIDRSRRGTESVEEQLEILKDLLTDRPVDEIVEFEKIRRRLMAQSYQSRLWSAAFLINGSASDDSFEHFRGWMIAQGGDAFYKALKDPDSLASLVDEPDVEAEEMLHVASYAYEEKTGRSPDSFLALVGDDPAFKYQDLDPREVVEDDDELRRLFPKLFKKIMI